MSVLIGGQKHSAKIKGTGGCHSKITPTPPAQVYHYGQDGQQVHAHRVEREQMEARQGRIREENRLVTDNIKNNYRQEIDRRNAITRCRMIDNIGKKKNTPEDIDNHIKSYFLKKE